MLGVLNATLSIGGLVGALLIGAWGGFRRRIDTIILAMVLVSVAIVFFGTRQSLAVMGAALFFAMLGVAVANATAMTLLQSKIPGDMQGRVFAIFTQLTLLLMPWGYLLVGLLADQVFTPWANSTAWREGPIGIQFGVGTAGGMGGLFAISAVLALLATLLAYALPSVRHLDAMLTTCDGATERTLAD
ncbi:hypothetical protein [Singulisphaera sp. GP187]|uniref:hypothetical protein n=1 Tax=Singulisphaera sp. GP187 TaxID=1882752 RepID=UPI00094120F2|nr:hypothetical protein [Singulisphaera sp. GP187]